MAENRRLYSMVSGFIIALVMLFCNDLSVEAGTTGSYLDGVKGGVATIMESATILKPTEKKMAEGQKAEEEFKIVMANVNESLNIRSDASEDAEKIGELYKDCGGTILERKNGWTKLQSGNVIGWAADKYLLFDEDAKKLANDVGRSIATVNTETLRVRKEPSQTAQVYGLLPKGDLIDVLDNTPGDWVAIDFEGYDAYVAAQYVVVDFVIDHGETLEEIEARKKAEEEAKRNKNYGEFTTDADTKMLLAALIHCEAVGESYEGQVAVGAVVMNRVRSSAYPDTIHGVIYASGQFTPAQNGKVNARYESGQIAESCIKAAEEALSGVSNVGDLTHFRRNNGREGLVIGNHVFY